MSERSNNFSINVIKQRRSVRGILCKSFFKLGGLLILVFLLAMALMPLQAVPAQAGDEKKGSIGSHTTIVQVERKTIRGSEPIELIAHGKLERGWLGISVQNLTPELARSFGAESSTGALVAEVVKGGPAEKAGVKQGDIVIVYGEKKITNATTLRKEVALSPIGQEVKVTVLRKGKKLLLTVTTGNLKDFTIMLATSLRDRLGAEVRLVTAQEAEKYSLNSVQGVAIAWLDPTGCFAEVGFEVGDIILEINGQAIEGYEGFLDLVRSLKPHQLITFLALDHRSGRVGYVQLKMR
jgi:serine protease Do